MEGKIIVQVDDQAMCESYFWELNEDQMRLMNRLTEYLERAEITWCPRDWGKIEKI